MQTQKRTNISQSGVYLLTLSSTGAWARIMQFFFICYRLPTQLKLEIWTPGIAINSTAKAPCVYNVKRDDSTIQQHNTWVINLQKNQHCVIAVTYK